MSVRVCYFIRHGETDLNREFRCQGKQDVPLNETGRAQIAETAKKLGEIEADAVYASPLRRAVESAGIIAGSKNLTVMTLDWLAEIFYGELEGMNFKECEARFPGILRQFQADPESVTFPGGEPVRKVAERLCRGLGELLVKDSGTIFLVTHQIIGGIAKIVLEGRPFSSLWEDKLVNGGFFRSEITPEHIRRLENFGLPGMIL